MTGAPGRNRTYNQRIRNPVLYPIELQAHIDVLKDVNKYSTDNNFENNKITKIFIYDTPKKCVSFKNIDNILYNFLYLKLCMKKSNNMKEIHEPVKKVILYIDHYA